MGRCLRAISASDDWIIRGAVIAESVRSRIVLSFRLNTPFVFRGTASHRWPPRRFWFAERNGAVYNAVTPKGSSVQDVPARQDAQSV